MLDAQPEIADVSPEQPNDLDGEDRTWTLPEPLLDVQARYARSVGCALVWDPEEWAFAYVHEAAL